MKRGRPRVYTDRQRYIISVMYLHGMSAQSIASILTRFDLAPLTRKKVSGIISQTPFNNRDAMPLSVRQGLLDKLKAHRLDGRILPDSYFEAT